MASANPMPENGALAKRTAPPPPTDTTFIDTILTRVNHWRSKHDATPLTWGATIASYAKTSASKCNGEYSTDNIYGENIYCIPETTTPTYSTEAITGIDGWYSEVSDYDVYYPDTASNYTQLVWKSSKKIGCSWSAKQCTDSLGTYYLYCEFSPKGNIEGEYEANVTP